MWPRMLRHKETFGGKSTTNPLECLSISSADLRDYNILYAGNKMSGRCSQPIKVYQFGVSAWSNNHEHTATAPFWPMVSPTGIEHAV